MDQATARKLQQIGKAFNLPGPFFSYEEILNGNVNRFLLSSISFVGF